MLSKVSKGALDENRSDYSPVIPRTDQLHQDVEEEKKEEQKEPIRKGLNMDMIPQEESKLEETQGTRQHIKPPPTSKAGAAKFNLFGQNKKKKSLGDGFSKFEMAFKKMKDDENKEA